MPQYSLTGTPRLIQSAALHRYQADHVYVYPAHDDQDRPLKSDRGGLILAFGILGWVLCFAFGIAAWVMGNNDLEEMRVGMMGRSGEALTKAGRILGMVITIIVVAAIALGFILSVLDVN